MRITVAGLKGGIGKTTSAAFLAHALAEAGRDVVAVDADPQASLRTWAEWAGWTVPVREFPTDRHVAAQWVRALDTDGWDVVIDTPPFDEGATAAAAAVASHVVYPMAPTGIEYERTDAMRALLARWAPQACPVMLLTRTVPGAMSTTDYRRRLTADGWHVLAVPVGRRERFAQAFGLPIVNAAASAYGDAVAELDRMEVPA